MRLRAGRNPARGTVDRQMKGQGGVFVRLPEGQKGFLRETGGLSPGQSLSGAGHGARRTGQGVALDHAAFLFKSRHVIVTPMAPGLNISRRVKDEEERARLTRDWRNGGYGGIGLMGLILRSAWPKRPRTVKWPTTSRPMRALAEAVMADLTTAGRSFWSMPQDRTRKPGATGPIRPRTRWTKGRGRSRPMGVEEAIDALLRAEVALPGWWPYGDRTDPGLCRGRCEHRRRYLARRQPEGQYRRRPRSGAPIAAAAALAARVIVDFAPMPKKDRATLDQQLKTAFRGEAAETVLQAGRPWATTRSSASATGSR